MKAAFSDRELEVMEALWDRGDATVREIMAEFDDDRAYRTYLSFMQVLEKKGHVTHRKEGRRYRYHPTTSRKDAQRAALRRVMARLFDSRPEVFVTWLIEACSLRDEERTEVLAAIEANLGTAEESADEEGASDQD